MTPRGNEPIIRLVLSVAADARTAIWQGFSARSSNPGGGSCSSTKVEAASSFRGWRHWFQDRIGVHEPLPAIAAVLNSSLSSTLPPSPPW